MKKTERQWDAFLRSIDRRTKKEALAKWKSSRALDRFVEKHGEVPARIQSAWSKNNYFVIHRCADRKNKWQLTEFDERGPFGDIRGSDYKTLAKKGMPTGPGHIMKWPSPEWTDWRRAVPLMRRNPIEVLSKGKVATSFMGGMAMESADHYEIVVTRDGVVAGKVHLYDDEDGLSVELLEASKDQRNKHAVVLPLLHAALKFAKSIKAPTLRTQVTWQGIFRVAVRFKKPSVAMGNDVLRRLADKKGLSNYWTPATFIVRPEDLPDEALYANYSDPETARTAPLYEGTDGIGLRKGSFFNTGEDIFQRVSSSDTEDSDNKIRKVQNLFLDYDFKKARNDRSLIKQGKVTTLEDLGSLLSKKTPMDSKKLNFDKLPMLTLMWDV